MQYKNSRQILCHEDIIGIGTSPEHATTNKVVFIYQIRLVDKNNTETIEILDDDEQLDVKGTFPLLPFLNIDTVVELSDSDDDDIPSGSNNVTVDDSDIGHLTDEEDLPELRVGQTEEDVFVPRNSALHARKSLREEYEEHEIDDRIINLFDEDPEIDMGGQFVHEDDLDFAVEREQAKGSEPVGSKATAEIDFHVPELQTADFMRVEIKQEVNWMSVEYDRAIASSHGEAMYDDDAIDTIVLDDSSEDEDAVPVKEAVISEPTEALHPSPIENVTPEKEVTTEHVAPETKSHDSSPAFKTEIQSEFLHPPPATFEHSSATKTKRRKIDALLFHDTKDKKLVSDQPSECSSSQRSYSPPPAWDTPNNRPVFNTKVKNVYESRGERLAREMLGMKAPVIPVKPASADQARRNRTAPLKHEKEDPLSEPEEDEVNYPPTEEQLVGPFPVPWDINNIISEITQWDVKWLDMGATKPPIPACPMPDEFDNLSSYHRYDLCLF